MGRGFTCQFGAYARQFSRSFVGKLLRNGRQSWVAREPAVSLRRRVSIYLDQISLIKISLTPSAPLARSRSVLPTRRWQNAAADVTHNQSSRPSLGWSINHTGSERYAAPTRRGPLIAGGANCRAERETERGRKSTSCHCTCVSMEVCISAPLAWPQNLELLAGRASEDHPIEG